ncbi:MAG: Peptidyl-tRNA hydrolase ArfB [Phycisphaerae bacterium]|nr:Peptidyl-tRNA hydrolase ArfB [Phycisphaerae bacterium]
MKPLPTLECLAPWIDAVFDRGGGPGGQHVNKVSTRVTLLLDFENCDPLSAWQKQRIRSRLKTRLSADGRLRVVSQSERSQLANRQDAAERMLRLIHAALYVQRPRTATRPTAASRRRRLGEKRARSETKRQRGGAWPDE